MPEPGLYREPTTFTGHGLVRRHCEATGHSPVEAAVLRHCQDCRFRVDHPEDQGYLRVLDLLVSSQEQVRKWDEMRKAMDPTTCSLTTLKNIIDLDLAANWQVNLYEETIFGPKPQESQT